MKLNKFFLLGMAGLAFAACSNEDDVAFNAGDGVNKTMVVSIAGISSGTTRATAPGEAWEGDQDATAAITNIQKIDLFFTDANGGVLYHYNATAPTGGSTDATWNALFSTTGVKFIGLTGVTQVHAIANAPTDIATTTDVDDLTTEFAQQGLSIAKTGVTYVGSDKDIDRLYQEPADATEVVELDGAGEEGNFYYSADIELVPIVSRIQINSVKIATSGSTTFPAEAVGNIQPSSLKLTWHDFKPALYGVYMNGFAPTFTDFAGTVGTLLENENYAGNIAGGQWLFDGEDYAADAAYVGYNTDGAAYKALLDYPEGSVDAEQELLRAGCLAFNLFVPFNVETGEASSIANPTFHFQFDKEVTDYGYDVTDADGNELTAEEQEFVNTADVVISNTLPEVGEGGYLFANVRTLYKEEGGQQSTTPLTLEPGKIYNMDITIVPANATVDLNVPTAYNVVVAVEVRPFTEENIYPELD